MKELSMKRFYSNLCEKFSKKKERIEDYEKKKKKNERKIFIVSYRFVCTCYVSCWLLLLLKED